jgi:YD repeat-containing protein
MTSFNYDAMGRLADVKNPLRQNRVFEYDANGNLSRSRNARGQSTSFEYDRVNQLVRKVRPAPETTIAYSYDPVGNETEVRESNNASILTMAYDGADRLISVNTTGTILGTGTIAYGYDQAGNLTSMVDPQGGQTTYLYDQLNHLQKLINPKRQETVLEYDTSSRRTRLEMANGTVMNYTYDDDGRITSLVTRKGPRVLSQVEYSYDSVGDRTRIVEDTRLNAYNYDADDQLVTASHAAATNPLERFSYDRVGNRLTSHNSRSYLYDNANRLLWDGRSDYKYDADGNIISKKVRGLVREQPIPTIVTTSSPASTSQMVLGPLMTMTASAEESRNGRLVVALNMSIACLEYYCSWMVTAISLLATHTAPG